MEETKEITKRDSNRFRIKIITIFSVISCILLVITIPVLIVETNKSNERPKTQNEKLEWSFKPEEARYESNKVPADESWLKSNTAVGDFSKRLNTAKKNGPSCECRFPFYPVANCTFCFHIPSFTDNGFVRLERFSKEEATKKCFDELKGEIPSSELSYVKSISLSYR